jgi:hypothetical protein
LPLVTTDDRYRFGTDLFDFSNDDWREFAARAPSPRFGAHLPYQGTFGQWCAAVLGSVGG